MKINHRKLLPYYIISIIMVSIAIVISIIIGISRQHGSVTEEEPDTVEPETLFMNGEVPYYPNIPASSCSTDLFVYNENGRMAYNDKNTYYSTGIDVSSHQCNIDWDAVANDGIDFAILRVGYRGYGASGNICIDDMFKTNAKNAIKAGLKIGVYFYSQAITVEEAKEEALFVIDAIKDFEIDCPVVFDWENEPDIGMRTDNLSGDILTDCAVEFCDTVKDSGYTPAVYFNLTDAYQRYNLDKISDYVFWYAQHQGSSPLFYYQYSIWQYSDVGTVDGISGNVDLNICFSSF